MRKRQSQGKKIGCGVTGGLVLTRGMLILEENIASRG